MICSDRLGSDRLFGTDLNHFRPDHVNQSCLSAREIENLSAETRATKPPRSATKNLRTETARCGDGRRSESFGLKEESVTSDGPELCASLCV
jgi:hypothetical protein